MSATRTPGQLRTGLLAAALLCGVPAACSDPTEPGHSDILLARAAWLSAGIDDYTFQIATRSSWFPMSGYTHVRVLNGTVASATDEDGSPINDYDLTIESIWQQILGALDRGELNSVRFGRRGVPIEVDMGDWALDGGGAYFIRNFAPDAS